MGLGASTGGVEALKKFLEHLGTPATITFILVQHLDDSGSLLAHEFWSKQTLLKVLAAQDGESLKSGVIYQVPSHSIVQIKNGVFRIRQASQRVDQVGMIDRLFVSLAKDYGAKAVGIIFSGEGADGAQGVKAISDAGGMTMAQRPELAFSPSMPQNAIATGVIDFITTPEKMPDELKKYSAHLEKQIREGNASAMSEQITSALSEICEILYKATRHDFKHYKTSTLVRRIQRRMQVLRLKSVAPYVEKLRLDPKEVDGLFKELLINVTWFFRDPEAFATLKTTVLAKMLKERKVDQKFRIWVPGCSTGEEVYTIAILVREILAKLPHPPEIQIIATDIDEIALNQARKGSYPVTISENVSPARLKKFFVRKGGRYHIAKELREIVLFSSHNLINDPPFSQLDLISCRNVLIYLGSHLQKKLIPVFHYALRPGGYLFLGTSESLTGHKDLFRTVSAKHRIAHRKATAIRPPGFSTTLSHAFVSHTLENVRSHETDIHLVSQRILLDEFAPKYAVVNDECQIISVSGGIAEYLDPTEGTFQNNILKLVKPSLRVGLRSTLNEAKKQKRKITHEDSSLKVEGKFIRIGITVQPMPQLGDEEPLYMVVFHYLGSLTKSDFKKSISERHLNEGLVVNQLEKELETLREDLDRSVQDLEASNEELKSSNEELLSMNEELQSANEELETSKEEVQNSNEALQRNNNDLENLMASTQIATLFLDDALTIMNFTPALESIYNLAPSDVGRPIANFTHKALRMPELPTMTTLKMARTPIEDDLQMQDGRWLLRRISPYRTNTGTYNGIVVTFIDVTNLRAAEERYRQLADSMPQIVWTATPNGEVDYINRRWYEFTGFSPSSDVKDDWTSLLSKEDLLRRNEAWDHSVQTGEPYEIEYRLKDFRSGSFRWFLARALAVKDNQGQISKWYGSTIDIHARVLAENQRRESEKRFQIMADTAPVLVWISGTDGLRSWFNAGWLEWTGRSMAQELGEGWIAGLHPQDSEHYLKYYRESFKARQPFRMEYRLLHRSGEFRWVSARGVPRFTADGSFEGYIGGCMDIHEQKGAYEAIETSKRAIENERENFRNLFRQTPEMVCILLGPDHIFEFVNEAHIKALGFDATGKSVREAQPESVEVHGILDDVYRTGITAELHEIPITLTGRLRYFNLTYAARKNGHGHVNGIMILGIEVTEQVLNRESISSQKQALELTLKGSPTQDVLQVLTAMIEEQMGEDTFCSALLIDPSGRRLVQGAAPHLPEDYCQAMNALFSGAALGSQAGSASIAKALEATDIRQNPLWAEFRELALKYGLHARWSTPIFSSQRKILGALVLYYKQEQSPSLHERQFMELASRTIALVIERRSAVEDLQKAKEEAEMARSSAEMANESKTRFLANMSHEIRTPLAAILGFTDLLQSRTEEFDPQARDQLHRISRNAAQLGRLIDDLLDLSKIEAERFEMEREDFDLFAALEDVLASVNLRVREKGLVLEHRASAQVPRIINTDPTRFRQILTNVVGNAVKFTEEGRIDVEFEVREDDENSLLCVRIRDTGIGMQPEHQKRIFARFVQGDSSVTRKYGGTGLGLILSRRLAQLMGGDLILEKSTLGGGSSFLITIALGPLKREIAQDRFPENNVRSAPLENLAGKKILVVDDSSDNQTIIRLFLESAQGQVEIANNGIEAIARLSQENFDVVLMDIQMPIMDGYQALTVARQNSYQGPIVALTAHALKEEKEACLAAGFTDYMSKPIDRQVLIRRVFELSRKGTQ